MTSDIRDLERRIERAEEDADDEDGPNTFAEAIKEIYHEENDT